MTAQTLKISGGRQDGIDVTVDTHDPTDPVEAVVIITATGAQVSAKPDDPVEARRVARHLRALAADVEQRTVPVGGPGVSTRRYALTRSIAAVMPHPPDSGCRAAQGEPCTLLGGYPAAQCMARREAAAAPVLAVIEERERRILAAMDAQIDTLVEKMAVLHDTYDLTDSKDRHRDREENQP